MTPMIRARSLTKVYDGDGEPTVALDGLELEVAPGELLAVMGPSASGKSTLLNLLAGLDRPTSGEVTLAGHRLDLLSEAERAVLRRRHVGFVFQLFNLISNMTVLENVELPALVAGAKFEMARSRARELLDQLGLGNKAHASPGRLSGGEQQRVALARALVNEPSVLLADEPTGNLDSSSARDVIAILRNYYEAGQTIVMVTHDPRVAASSDRVAHLRDGRLRDETRIGDGADAKSVLARMIELEF